MATLTPARVALAVSIVVILALISLGADANHIDVRDPNDTRGRLDVRRVEVFGKRRVPVWKVITDSTWTNRQIYERGFVIVFLDTFGDGDFDYYAVARTFDGRMFAALFRDRHPGRDFKVSSLKEWRGNKRSVSVRIPLREMRLGGKRVTYRWEVQTLFTGNRCRRVCFDFAPDGAPVVEPRPDVTPSPSPSVTPTP